MKITDSRLEELLSSGEANGFDKTFEFRGAASPAPQSNIKRRIIISSAAVAAAALLAVGAFAAFSDSPNDIVLSGPESAYSASVSGSGSVPVESPAPDLSEEPDVSGEEPSDPGVSSDVPLPVSRVPEWYVPGSLLAKTVTGSDPSAVKPAFSVSAAPFVLLAQDNRAAASENYTIPGISESAPAAVSSARYINYAALYAAHPEHAGHGDLFYDTKTGEVLCLQCKAREISPYDPSPGESIFVDVISTPEYISFGYIDPSASIVKRFIYRVSSGEATELPVLSSNDLGMFKANPDFSFVTTRIPGGFEGDEVYIVDVAGMRYELVSDGYNLFNRSEFSPDGENLLCVIRQGSGAAPEFEEEGCRFLLINVRTLEKCECKGKVLSYSDGLLVTRAGDGYHVYDRAGCSEITPEGDVFCWEIRSGSLIRANAATGEQTVLGTAPDGWLISPDGRYFYSYNSGEESLVCFDLASGGSFSVGLGKAFVAETASLKNGHEIDYTFSLNDGMDEILICYYYYAKSPFDPYASRSNAQRMRIDDCFYNVNVTSLRELMENSKDVFNFGGNEFVWRDGTRAEVPAAVAFRGEGYVYVMFESIGACFAEDYRDHTFTGYFDSMSGGHYCVSTYGIYDGEFRVVGTDADEQSTLEYLQSLGVEIRPADIDYKVFYKNGVFSRELAWHYYMTDDFMDRVGWSTHNKQSIREFIAYFRDCEKTLCGDDPVVSEIYGDHGVQFAIELHQFHFKLNAFRGADGGCYIVAGGPKPEKYRVSEEVYQKYFDTLFTQHKPDVPDLPGIPAYVDPEFVIPFVSEEEELAAEEAIAFIKEKSLDVNNVYTLSRAFFDLGIREDFDAGVGTYEVRYVFSSREPDGETLQAIWSMVLDGAADPETVKVFERIANDAMDIYLPERHLFFRVHPVINEFDRYDYGILKAEIINYMSDQISDDTHLPYEKLVYPFENEGEEKAAKELLAQIENAIALASETGDYTVSELFREFGFIRDFEAGIGIFAVRHVDSGKFLPYELNQALWNKLLYGKSDPETQDEIDEICQQDVVFFLPEKHLYFMGIPVYDYENDNYYYRIGEPGIINDLFWP